MSYWGIADYVILAEAGMTKLNLISASPGEHVVLRHKKNAIVDVRVSGSHRGFG